MPIARSKRHFVPAGARGMVRVWPQMGLSLLGNLERVMTSSIDWFDSVALPSACI